MGSESGYETGREKMITHPSQAESKKREAATKEVYTTQRSKETTMIMILEASRDLCCACANTVSLSDRETEELVQLGKERNKKQIEICARLASG